MTAIFNPGSGPVATAGDGWTNTYETAEAKARGWLDRMTSDGIRDVDLNVPALALDDGRWRFEFRHQVTGVVVHLDTHGVDDFEAYEREHIFGPRIYWSGSSCGEPRVEDWSAAGFEVVKTLRPVAS